MGKGAHYWQRVLEWNQKEQALTEKEIGIVNVAARMPAKIPTEKQCLALVDIEQKAIQDGLPESG